MRVERRYDAGGYKQFCPVAMASEVLCNRWTMVLLRELLAGSTRFNDLRRGVPRMSPALLSQPLKELTATRIIETLTLPGGANRTEYRLTEAGCDLKAVVEAVGIWGQRWIPWRHPTRRVLSEDNRRNPTRSAGAESSLTYPGNCPRDGE